MPTSLKGILWRAKAEAKHQEETRRQRTEQQRRHNEQRQRLEALRDLFQQAFEAAHRGAEDPNDPTHLSDVTERIMALGLGMVAERLGGLLDALPMAGTLHAPVYLPLHFAIQVLRQARDRKRKKVRAALHELRDHPNLRDYYRWFPVVADRFCGYADAMPGVPGKLVQPPPLPEECLTPAHWKEVERALGFVLTASSASTEPRNQRAQDNRRGENFLEPAAELNAGLSHRQYDILKALYQLKAFTSDSRQTTATIACEAEGKHVNPESFKVPLAQLRYRTLVESKSGRGGGIWLTPAGKVLIRRVRNL
jgi:hypothetical protein